MTFQELGLNKPILSALADQGYETPSPIQMQAIPHALAGRDVLGCAQTGTGKTCAFATPILQRLSAVPTPKPRHIRTLILTPTRELAIQIQESFEAYGKNLPLRSAVIFGGVGQAPQVDKIRRGLDILVATPGRLGDLYNQKLVDLSHIEIFVLDEADRMLDMGFIHDVKRILQWLPKKKQTLFFSATMPPEITDLVNSLLHDPARVAVNPVSSTVEIIDQKLYMVDRVNKTKLLADLIRERKSKSALVFSRTKHGANKIATDLIKAGITAAAIHGNKSQTARQQALADFKAGKITALVATDIAARGIDIDELALVFNYNLPEVPETYVHRIGRTGRAGHGGTAISFCDFDEKGSLKDIEKLIGKAVPLVKDHPYPMEVFEATKKDSRGRPVNAEDAEARAAAKERRRTRDAEKKAAADARKTKAAAEQLAKAEKASQSSQKSKSSKGKGRQTKSEKVAEVVAPKEKPQGRRGYRASATLEEALRATAPKPYDENEYKDFRRPAALESDVVMDATARMLAPRKPMFSSPKPQPSESRKPNNQGKKQQTNNKGKSAAPAPEKFAPKKAASAPAPTPAKKKGQTNRFNGGRRNTQPEMRRSNQKDSTEQPSLMKAYYLNDD